MGNSIKIPLCRLHFFVLTVLPTFIHAQDGSPDMSFGSGGTVITSTSTGYESGYAIAVQPDGKIVVSGESQNGTVEGDYNIVVLRYNADGSLDGGFGNGGIIIRPVSSGWDLSGSVLVQPDGKIVVGGNGWTGSTYDFVALRYNADGTPDNSFGSGGMAFFPMGGSQDNAWDCALQADGKILLTGPVHNGNNYDFGLARLNPNGSLDGGFGSGGRVITPLGTSDDLSWFCAVQPDGNILVAGRAVTGGVPAFALMRYLPNGSPDNSFGAGGKVITSIGGVSDRGRVVAIQPDGKIVVGGTSTIGASDDFALVRYNPDGSLDNTFGTNGKVTTPVGSGEDILWDVLVQNNGKILASGYGISPVSGYDFAVVRYNTDGSLDPTFGVNGIALTPVGAGSDFGIAMALQSDAKIVMVGATVGAAGYDVGLVRLQNALSGVTASGGEEGFALLGCYPDPFEAATQVSFQLPQSEFVTLSVYDLSGRKVATLVNETLGAGSYERTFDASGLAGGMYLFRFQAGVFEQTGKAILVK